MGAESAATDLSVVIATRNTRELLESCLASIEGGSGDLRVEVVVVDNASSDGTREMLSERFPEVRVIHNTMNRAFAEANNQGLTLCRGRFVMLLNSDTEVTPDALPQLVRYLEQNPRVGACGPQLRYPDGKIQISCFSFESPLRHLLDMLALGRLFPGTRVENLCTRFAHLETRPVDWVLGAAIVARREVLDTVGGLDERFSVHCNDSDWCLRIRKAGFEIHYLHRAEVLHHSGATIRREQKVSGFDEEMLSNLFEYHRKYYGRAGVAWLRFWMVIGFGARRLLTRIASGGPQAEERMRRFGWLAAAGLTGHATGARKVTR